MLRDLRPDLVTFDLYRGDECLRGVDVHFRFGKPEFPRLQSDTTETLGSDAADAHARERAAEELVRLEAARVRWSR